MPAQWTGEVIGEMHLAGISKRDIAKELGVTAAYVCMILNGDREPKGGEARVRAALERLKAQKAGA